MIGEQRGQVLPFVVLVVLALALLTLPLLSAAWLLGTRTAVQRAADAAALAGAGQATIARQVDARGNTYCETLAVDPVRGPAVAARYWAENTEQASVRTRSFLALPEGRTLTVRATVVAPGGGLAVFGRSAVGWVVSAEARLTQPRGIAAC